jgi:hypothetical protein
MELKMNIREQYARKASAKRYEVYLYVMVWSAIFQGCAIILKVLIGGRILFCAVLDPDLRHLYGF